MIMHFRFQARHLIKRSSVTTALRSVPDLTIFLSLCCDIEDSFAERQDWSTVVISDTFYVPD